MTGYLAEQEDFSVSPSSPPAAPHRASTGGIAAEQLKSIIARIETLEEEKAAIASDIKDIFAEAKGNGYDVKTLRRVIALRKQDAAERDEAQHLLDTYCVALGMKPQMELFEGNAPPATEDDDDLYEEAKAIVVRDAKPSPSYIQRVLRLGYNRAASLIERMEREGIVSPANHVGKREVLRQAE